MKKITAIFLSIYFIVTSLSLNAFEENNNKYSVNTDGYAAYTTKDELKPYSFQRRELQGTDVGIDISYCGICHSDLHAVKGEWGEVKMPLVPGHEIVGIVSAVGDEVSMYNVGDKVGVGCLIDSCGQCFECESEQEQFCNNKVFTYGSIDKQSGEVTQGGYSNYIVVKEEFVLKIPENLALEKVAPLLCAGITTYSALSAWNIDIDSTIAVVGVGGLGHITIKIAKALGATVVAFTHSPNKIDDIKQLGVDEVVVTNNDKIIEEYKENFDMILDTVSAPHDVNMYLEYLKRDGTLIFVGMPEKEVAFNVKSLILKRRNISGSIIGGITETQDMLTFCGENNITADVEVISADEINKGYERMLASDVKYRFVIDASTFKQDNSLKED